MYDTYPWDDSAYELSLLYGDFNELDLVYGDFLDPDKPFSMNLSESDLMDIAEKGYDDWLMGLAGIL